MGFQHVSLTASDAMLVVDRLTLTYAVSVRWPGVKVMLAARWPSFCNSMCAVAKRLGGGFGGKASRSMPVAAAAALAAAHFTRPVCYSLSRNDDLLMNHGRCLGQVTYDVGFDDSGKVHAIKAQVMCWE